MEQAELSEQLKAPLKGALLFTQQKCGAQASIMRFETFNINLLFRRSLSASCKVFCFVLFTSQLLRWSTKNILETTPKLQMRKFGKLIKNVLQQIKALIGGYSSSTLRSLRRCKLFVKASANTHNEI